jgi:integrase
MLTAHMGGDVPVESITPLQLAEFYKSAVRLPARPRQHELAMSFQELVAQDIPKARRLTIQTVANWMNLLHSACSWGRKMRFVCLNPIADNMPSTVGAKPKYPTLVPTDEEIATFFSSSIYTDRPKSPAWFWLPLLAVYTGARLNELGQLERADVIWGEIPCLSITTDTTEDNDEDAPSRRTKTLKTGNSQRRMPLHPRLLELGFRDYWQSFDDFHLFPDLPHKNLRANETPTQNFSRDFGRYLRKLGMRRGVKFHSFRHLFTDLADDMGVNPKVRSVLVGHANENDLTMLLGSKMTDSYGSGYGRRSRLQFMLDEVSKVHYPSIPAINPWR